MLFFLAAGLYVAIGLVVAFAFVAGRPGHVLEPPAEVSPGARVLLIPGAMFLWPLVVARWWMT